MRWTRLVAGVVGVVAVAVALVASPADAGIVDSAIDVLGSDYAFVAVFGAGALLLAVPVQGLRGIKGVDQAEPPDSERVLQAPSPGTEFDGFLAEPFAVRSLLGGTDPDAVRERLRTNAVRALARTREYDRQEAERAVAEGTWTDDRVAAAFLADSSWPGPDVPLAAEALLRADSPSQFGARRAAAAIVEREAEAR